MTMCKNQKIEHVQVYIGMKSTLVLNGCAISGGHIPSGIIERDGIGKIQVRSKAIHRLSE